MPLVAIAAFIVMVMSQAHIAPFDRVLGPGYTMVATQGTYGIIIDAHFAERFLYLPEGQSAQPWTPSRDDVAAAEELLRPHRPGDALDGRARREFDSPEEAVSRTWYGAIVDGQRLLYVDGYCSGGLPSNPLQPVRVMDGGACYWHATIDAERWEIVSYVENGVA